jgi:hypothetical protein
VNLLTDTQRTNLHAALVARGLSDRKAREALPRLSGLVTFDQDQPADLGSAIEHAAGIYGRAPFTPDLDNGDPLSRAAAQAEMTPTRHGEMNAVRSLPDWEAAERAREVRGEGSAAPGRAVFAGQRRITSDRSLLSPKELP